MDYELLASNPADSVRVGSARWGKARVAFTVEELIANWEIGLQTGEFFRIDPLR